MAMYHLETKPIKRSAGRTATASSAYRNAIAIEDLRTGLKFDYGKKNGVVANGCFMIDDDGQKINLDNSELWNAAELTEKRKDSRVAREIIINLPHELDDQERLNTVTEFTEKIAKLYKVGIDFAIHRPDQHGDQRNHHAHIMLTTRAIKLDNAQIILGDKTQLEWENGKLKKMGLPVTQEQITDMRKLWQDVCNDHLAKADINAKIDSRSYAEQGIDLVPTIKLGWQASALERKGVATVKGDYNRQVRAINAQIEWLDIEMDSLQIDLHDYRLADMVADNEAKHAQAKDRKAPTPFNLPTVPTPFDTKPQKQKQDIQTEWRPSTDSPAPAEPLPVSSLTGDSQPQALPHVDSSALHPLQRIQLKLSDDTKDSQLIIRDLSSNVRLTLDLAGRDITQTLSILEQSQLPLKVVIRTPEPAIAQRIEVSQAEQDSPRMACRVVIGNDKADIKQGIIDSTDRINGIREIIGKPPLPALPSNAPAPDQEPAPSPAPRRFKP